MNAAEYRDGATRQENYRRMQSCTARFHDFRAPPPIPGIPNWATCTVCGATASREASSLYIAGVRAGLVMASSMAMETSAGIRQDTQNALQDANASCEGAE